MKPMSDLLDKMSGARVLVVGDVMLDRFVEGTVERISPEAPVPVLTHESENAMPGGAANVAVNISALGARVALVGVRGADPAGDRLSDLLASDFGVETAVAVIRGRRTPEKIRFIARQHILRVDDEIVVSLSANEQKTIADAITADIGQFGSVVLSDYGKGMFIGPRVDDMPLLARRIVQAADDASVPVLVDTKSPTLAGFEGATILKPNLAELRAITGYDCRTDEEIERAAQQIINTRMIPTVVVTRGRDGVTVVGAGNTVHIPGSQADVYDLTGAGDTFMAALAAGIAAKATVADAAALACEAAAIVVGKVGTAVATREEIDDRISGRPLMIGGNAETMGQTLARWRRRRLKIGFTNGVFDLLHIDHVDYLRRCREKCDRLVVGINSDASVRRLKGEGRPIVPQRERAELLTQLRDVDVVSVFDFDTPASLIKQIQPDVLFKDSGYEPQDVAGADLLQEWGGELMILDRGTRMSTTERIEALQLKPVDPPARLFEDHRTTIDVYERARAWLYDQVLPWWRENAFDEHSGLFHEDFVGDAALNEPNRVMVQARQIAVFSHANHVGIDFAQRSFSCLQKYRPMTEYGAWHHSTKKAKFRLYDQAFVLFALAHVTNPTGPVSDLPEDAWRVFQEGMPGLSPSEIFEDWYGQDGWMHMLEACIAFHDAKAGPQWLGRARELADRATRTFIVNGVLYEHFSTYWNRAVSSESFEYEISPGHHFEWVWLLHQMARITGHSTYLETADKLFAFGIKCLEAGNGAVPYAVDPDAKILDGRRRLWPQCEALRAVHAMATRYPRSDIGPLRRLAENLLATILDKHANGPVWHEWLDELGTPTGNRVPASSLYHLYFCLEPVLRATETGTATITKEAS